MPEMETIVKVIESDILVDICLSRITELLRFTSLHFELLNVKTALNVSKKAFTSCRCYFCHDSADC